jgi:hypothetical protein
MSHAIHFSYVVGVGGSRFEDSSSHSVSERSLDVGWLYLRAILCIMPNINQLIHS